MKLAVTLLLLTLPLQAEAWNPKDHQLLVDRALKRVAGEWGLNQPVPVQPLASLLKKLPAEVSHPTSFAEWLGINPSVDLEKSVPEVEGRKELTPIEILSYYSIDPDDGRDENLFIRDEQGRPIPKYPDQKWFGSVEGPTSRAFRHIEKPPFSPQQPISTFGFPLEAVGEATRRAEIWFLLSELASKMGEPYWRWRFLANALHYLEDLNNPYHAAQITPDFLLRGLAAYLAWGKQEYDLLGTIAHLLSNSHGLYENYIDQPGGRDRGMKERILLAVEGVTLLPATGIRDLALITRDSSNLLFPSLLDAVTRATKPILLGPYTYAWWSEEVDPPTSLLAEGEGFEEANRQIFELTANRFAHTGLVIRTAIRLALDQKDSRTVKEIMSELNEKL